jgi:hypothetical protein
VRYDALCDVALYRETITRRPNLIVAYPAIGHADWNAITSDNHVVQLGTLAMPTTLDIELLLGSGVKLRLLVFAGAASRLEAALASALRNRLKHPHIALPPGRA